MKKSGIIPREDYEDGGLCRAAGGRWIQLHQELGAYYDALGAIITAAVSYPDGVYRDHLAVLEILPQTVPVNKKSPRHARLNSMDEYHAYIKTST